MNQSIKKAAIALAIQSVIFAPVVFAEEAAEEQKEEGTLEKIVVTATKRTQSAQEVPISISTMYGEQFENLFAAGDDILALANRIPGLYAETSNGRVAPRFYIRGLGNTDFDLAASQPVSIIMDEVVMENVVLKSFPLFDIEGVEVIRGPQGTLFGRNTTAGIIKFDSRKPTDFFEAHVKLATGDYGMRNVEAAISGAISDDVTARLSVLNQHKDDWVENAFTGQKDAMGGFDETAFRLQAAFQPSEALDVLFNAHGRNYDGTATLFRANILTTGSNELNANYDVNSVWYDEGDNNPQEYDGHGAILKIDYDMGDMTLTSITATESADGRSLGDIDGGAGAVYLPYMRPGFIPFNSATQDAADVSQFTQELRLASDTAGDYTWQVGFFYFDSELEVETNPFFVAPSTVNQENTTWAVFGQMTYDISDKTTFIGGLRYTDDEKSLTAVSGGGVPISPVNLDDGQVSWELMLNHQMSSDVSVYGRVASGFRAQSIQGRDIAFFGTPSVADSETILSFEAGFKADLMEDTLRVNGAIFTYEVSDIQLTMVGGNGNNVGLANADTGAATGFELDTVFHVNDYITLTAGYSYNDTELQDKNLLIPTCGSGQCTPTDRLDANGAAYVDGNPFPQAPKTILSLTGRFTYPVESGEFYGYVDFAQQGDTNLFIYDSIEYNLDTQHETGLRIGYINEENEYEIAVFGKNITNEHNIKGGIDFNNNTAFVNDPRIWGVEFKKDFF